jgi:putative ABC transport system permease protein
MMFHYKYVDERVRQEAPHRAGDTGWYIVRIANPDDSAAVSEAIDKLFANSRAETKTETERAFQQSFLSAASAIITAMNIMSFVIIGIILLVRVTWSCLCGKNSRVHGTCVCFSGPSLFFLIAGESMILAVLGSAFGLLVTLPAVEGFQNALPKGWFPVFYIKPETILFACVAGLLVGFIASIIPIRRILMTRIVEGLRHVG